MTWKVRKKVNREKFCILLIALTLFGCNSTGGRGNKVLLNPYYPDNWTIAVIPFKNDSGSDALSTIAVTDEFYTELSSVGQNIQVIPVNRVLATQHKLKISKVAGPDDVAAIADDLGVDAVIVGVITRYQPYPPPLAGIIVQLYDRKGTLPEAINNLDPGKIARSGKPIGLAANPKLEAIGQASLIVDADKKDVVEQMKNYARRRGQDTPLGWRKVMTSSEFMRFVSHIVIERLLLDQRLRTDFHQEK